MCGMLQGLIVQSGSRLAETEINEAGVVTWIERDCLTLRDQRFLKMPELVQVHREGMVRGRQVRVDRERPIRGIEAAAESGQIPVHAA